MFNDVIEGEALCLSLNIVLIFDCKMLIFQALVIVHHNGDVKHYKFLAIFCFWYKRRCLDWNPRILDYELVVQPLCSPVGLKLCILLSFCTLTLMLTQILHRFYRTVYKCLYNSLVNETIHD
jgi:hypothetical protein